MKKMNVPPHDAINIFDECVNGIDDLALWTAFTSNRANIQLVNDDFDAATVAADWAALPRVPKGNPTVLIAGTLNKKQLMDLYTDYMVGSSGPSRTTYDELLTAAGGLCPFCGGLGHAWTLDHYLPKSNFPAYSVHPSNLVPCCRDCNTGKNASFGAVADQQTLHPYLDLIHFFEERWIVATAYRESPVLLRFECAPPTHWSNTDKGRVLSHFKGYKLAYRFSIQAGGEVSKVIQLRANSLRQLSEESFRNYLLDNAHSTDFVLNGWSRTMYAALAASDWFLQTDFGDPNWHLVAQA